MQNKTLLLKTYKIMHSLLHNLNNTDAEDALHQEKIE